MDGKTISSSETSWSDLLAAAKAGNRAAFGEICTQLHEYLLLTAEKGVRRGLQRKLAASDVVQQTFLEAQQEVARFNGNTKLEFQQWMLTLLRHNLIDGVRRYDKTQKREANRELPHHVDQIVCRQKRPSSLVRRRETDLELTRAIAKLSDRNRRVIELRHRDKLRFAEIAAIMNISEPAARQLWGRAVEKLRQFLSHDDARKTPFSP